MSGNEASAGERGGGFDVVKAVGGLYDLFGKAGMQGSSELASALFQGSGYVPYGPGQQPARMEAGNEAAALFGPEQSGIEPGKEVSGIEAPQHGLSEPELARDGRE